MTTINRNILFSGTGTGFSDALYPSTDTGGTIRMGVVLASTGTIAWQHTMDGTNWYAIAAYDESGQALATAAIASGIYTINASASYAVRANITANGSGLVLTGTVVKGGGGGGAGGSSGGGGGGGDYAKTVQYTDTTLGTIVPAGDIPGHEIYTFATGRIVDGTTAAGVSSLLVGSPDSGGLMRTPQSNLASANPISTADYGYTVNANLRGLSSANTLRTLVTATGFSAGGTGATTLMVAEARASNVTAGTYEQVYNNINVSVLTSSARTTTQTSADQTNFNHCGIKIVLDVTSGTSLSLVLALNDKDLNSAKYSNVLTSATITGVGTYVFRMFPGATAAANLTVNDILSRLFQLVVTAGNSNSATYSLSYSLLV